MQQWSGLEQVPAGFGPSVVALGNFDGVHRGHASVLRAVVARARALDAQAVAVTFDPHPLAVLSPEHAPPLLTTLRRKLELLEQTGLDAVLVLPFTPELASWTPERFVADVLVGALGARVVCAGRDARFGRAGAGSLDTLRELGGQHGFDTVALEDVHGDGQGDDDDGERRWSSSWVRELLAEGQAGAAAVQLGRPHRVEGVVVHGDHRGRELGYPTANLGEVEVVIPADGVYAGWLVRLDLAGLSDAEAAARGGRVLPAAISVGTNPTFDGLERRLEAHALVGPEASAKLDLYGERVGVDVVELLRPTLRFDSAQALIDQMDADVVRCREVLAEHPVEC
ncbi:FMN adenylyltransferase /riboflavin kinase [Quadrisphaera granulorum]|uniref:Riboflavin biosynthesis protein n=1 Tax=Quadrisphaera granulorum TaxID=317664 RepID=A0A316AFR9_9ACTN|nr:bifunctional riboflavin kinase/FAD synthetase [Quadrisphaera granulorum]PWJ56461.1 FMN adenylyltransferase /riboflavin kinase [Quadrisphaera granulorum]SZE95095.1 FMN adenylyltransferase /riboflavin kinase [Quadrisphaera granulorum]